MPRRLRFPKLETADQADLPGWQLSALAQRGLITWARVAEIVAERAAARNGGVDPYAHLRPGADDDDDDHAA